MWWDGPMDGVSDCSPRMTKLLEYAAGALVSTGKATLNPWSDFKVDQQSVFAITGAVPWANPANPVHSITTSAPHLLQAGSSFTLAGCAPAGWNGVRQAALAPRGAQSILRPRPCRQ